MKQEHWQDRPLTDKQKQQLLEKLQGEISRLPGGSDFGDFGNLVGIAAASAAKSEYPDELRQIKDELISGVKHGFELIEEGCRII